MADLTILTTEKPRRLSKEYTLQNGELKKAPGGQLSQGSFEIAGIDDLAGLARIIAALTPAQALTYGVPRNRAARRIASRAARRGEDTITRTEDDFAFSSGRAVMMLDYDPREDGTVLSREQLCAKLLEACPALEGVQMLWTPSSSSHICRAAGEDLTGLRGQRLYLFVEDGTDIPRAGKVLLDRLWLSGEGYVKLSSAGSMLDRALFDGSVWQASRMDFAAGAATGRGLEQRRGEPVVIGPDKVISIDSRVGFPDLTEEEKKQVSRIQDDARHAISREATEMRRLWLDGRRSAQVRALSDDTTLTEDRDALERMLDEGELPSDIVIFVEIEANSGTFEPVRVRDICLDPERHAGCRTLDPLEPDYRNYSPVGKIFVRKDGAVVLNSFAHGGCLWTLESDIVTVERCEGPTALTTTALLEEMREDGPFFDYGDGLAAVLGRRLMVLDEHALDLALASRIHIVDVVKGVAKAIDPPPRLLKQMISAKAARGLRPLKGMSDRPIVRPDGTIVTRPGFDEQTGIYVSPEDPEMGDIPDVPTTAEMLKAIDTIWEPVALFPYADAPSRGAVLAAILTSALIESFSASPAFQSDGPVRAAGKTLLLRTVATLGAGRAVGVTPMPGDNMEMAKTLTSAVHPDHTAKGLIFDNCSGTIRSDALAALITGDTYTGRILGTSRLLMDVPARLFIGITGTNLELDADLGRRFLSWRLDTDTEVAFDRTFDFHPIQRVLERRPEIIAAILTLVRAAQQAPVPDIPALGSFEDWDRIVRRAVLLAVRLRPDLFADPVAATIQRVISNDAAAEHRDLLEALEACFGEDPFTSRDVWTRLRLGQDAIEGDDAQLVDVFRDLGRKPEELSTRSIGRHLLANRDRWSDGLVLKANQERKSRTWWVAQSAERRAETTLRLAS